MNGDKKMFKLDAKCYVHLYSERFHNADFHILFIQSGYKNFRLDLLLENKDGKLNYKYG